MSNSSPNGRTLLSEARAALRPNDEDRERVAAALRARLGAAVLPGAISEQAGAAATQWLPLRLVASVVAGAGLIGGLVYVGGEASPPTATLRRLPSAAVSVVAFPQPPPSSAAPPQSPAPSKPMERAPGSGAQRADGLAREVAILARAARELRSGRAREALKSLDEHQRQFPAGVLAEERRAAKAQALCTLGRAGEAKAELLRLAKSAPQSASAARARQFCATRTSAQR